MVEYMKKGIRKELGWRLLSAEELKVVILIAQQKRADIEEELDDEIKELVAQIKQKENRCE